MAFDSFKFINSNDGEMGQVEVAVGDSFANRDWVVIDANMRFADEYIGQSAI